MTIRGGGFSRLVHWLLEYRVVALAFVVLLIGAGLYVSPFSLPAALDDLPRDPVPVDAIPDIGENQQIVFTEWSGRSPRDVEDQITYPLTTALMGIAGVRTVRSSSALGFSTIYIIFDDDVEFYWSRSRVLEKLSSLRPGTVPDGVTPTLGPDATALGQIFWYTLEGRDPTGETVGGWDPDELRSIQDWTVRYALQSVDGVSEVASVGGFVREYQVDVDPEALRGHGITLTQVVNAVRNSNLDVGARTLEVNRVEYVVRGLGFVKSIEDLETTVVVARDHTPIRVRDVARVALGPSLRRGALDDEGAPAVGGVVVSRFGDNPLAVINAVKAKIAQIQPGLPRRSLDDGRISQITIVPFYDRTTLINETLGTLSTALYQQLLITLIVVLLMLRNVRSALLISMMLPLGVMATFVLMRVTGVDANVMALAGIAIAIGSMVDIGTVFIENIKRNLDNPPDDVGGESRLMLIRHSVAEVAPAVTTSVLTTVVSFLPVFGLESTELRLFGPLAVTKTFAMASALMLALLFLPGAALVVLRRRTRSPGSPDARAGGRVTSADHSQWKELLSRRHWPAWMLIAAGLLLAQVHMSGFAVAAVGLYRWLFYGFGVARLDPAWQRRLEGTELLVGTMAVAWVLTDNWLPLGESAGFIANAAFVAGLLIVVMGSFWLFIRNYPALLQWVLRRKRTFLLLPLLISLFGSLVWLGADRVFAFLPSSIRSTELFSAAGRAMPGLGREYLPPFDEGAYLYMPSTMPHASIGEVLTMLSDTDAAIAQIPEVDRVVGKLGRVDSALDPAPVSMIETVITYKPEYVVDESGERTRQWRDHIRTPRDIWDEIVRAADRPGLTSAPVLMPINARIVMLQSGMRAPLGIKVRGPDLESIERFGQSLEQILRALPSVRAETVFADRVVGKPYLEIELDREAIGRYGLAIADVQRVLQVALGGITLTRTVEGRERYPVRVRYMREERDSIESLARVLVPTSTGEPIPLGQLTEVRYVRGPQMLRSEDTFLTSYVVFDRMADTTNIQVVEAAQLRIQEAISNGTLSVPDGVSFEFAGAYKNQVRTEQRLMLLVPFALTLVFALLYLQFRRALTSSIIFVSVAVAVSGGFAMLWLYGQPWFLNFELFGMDLRDLFQVGEVNMSVAVWIGLVALMGIATDDGVVMMAYLKQRFAERMPSTVDEIRQCTLEAGTRRLRPCLMTTATTILAMLPVMTSQGRGADVMLPLALPIFGGMTIELITLFVVPVLFCAVQERRLKLHVSATTHRPS